MHATYFTALIARVATDASRAATAAEGLVGQAVEELAVLLGRDMGITFDAIVAYKEAVLRRVMASGPSADDARCKGTAKDGGRCRHRVAPGGNASFCAAHRAQGEKEASKRRRIEAYQSSRSAADTATLDPIDELMRVTAGSVAPMRVPLQAFDFRRGDFHNVTV